MCRAACVVFGLSFVWSVFRLSATRRAERGRTTEQEDVKLSLKNQMRHDHDSNFIRQSPWCKIHGDRVEIDRNEYRKRNDNCNPRKGMVYLRPGYLIAA